MARFGSTLAVLLFAIAATDLVAAQRPTLDEYKDGKKAEAAAKAEAGANDAKMAAVNKVMKLFEDLKAKVVAEGEAEAASYNKFACFCKDSTKEKHDSITKGTDEQTDLIATINQLAALRDDLDDEIARLEKAMKERAQAMKEATDERAATLKEYKTNSADLDAAIYGLNGAIKTLKGSKTASLLQVQGVSNTVRTSLALADAMGLLADSQRDSLSAFLQQPENGNEVPMEDYKFHSDGVIGTLEKLLKDFTNEKNEVDAAEVKSVSDHDKLMNMLDNEQKEDTKSMEAAKKKKDDTIAQIELSSKELSTVEATLRDDKEYLGKLSDMCSDKAKTWDVRLDVRQQELQTIKYVMTMLKERISGQVGKATVRFMQSQASVRVAKAVASDAGAMNELEAEAEAMDAPAFVQISQHSSAEPATVIRQLLEKRGKELKSTLLTELAGKITSVSKSGGDPFAKIKTLIQELIERLLEEAAAEANQKGWCDKATADAEQKRDYAVEEIEELNSEMARLEATRDQLNEDLTTLDTDLKALYKERNETTATRLEDKAENEETTKEATEGLEVLEWVMGVMEKSYGTMANTKVDLSLFQADPFEDAPDAGFKNGEAYTGAQGAKTGIMAMLDVMKSDFARTISETAKEEAQQAKDYLEFMTQSGISVAEKEQAFTEKTSQRDEAVEKLDEADEELTSQTKILQGSLKELMELKPTCIDTGMTYEERVARREEEIASLKKAACILDAYAEYGPEGAADKC
jgi:organic radical activating enzyme